MPYIIPLFVHDFSSDKQLLTIKIARVMLLSPLFFSISYVLGGILNSFKRFLVYSLAPLIYNISIIMSTLLLSHKIGIWAPVYGVVIGAFLHMVIQIPQAIALGWRPKLSFHIHSGIGKIVRLMIPRSIGMGANQLMLLFYTSIAASLGAGSVAVLNFADNIQTMPTVVFGTSFATAAFPTLATYFAEKKEKDFTALLFKTIRSALYILIPMGIGIILLRSQIVRIILGSGEFGWQQTIATFNTLGWFAVALFAQGLVAIIARAFYAIHNTRTPTIISVISVIISIILGWIFSRIRILGVAGLALGFSVGGIINAGLLYYFLRKKIPSLMEEEKGIIQYIGKILVATLFMAIVVQIIKVFIGEIVDMQRYWGLIVQVIASIIFGGSIYLFTTFTFKIQEIKEIKEIMFIIKAKFIKN